jgi:hypothetical protein
MTAFSDLAVAICSALTAVPPLAGGRVYRGAAWPMPEDVDEMIWIRPVSTSSERAGITGGPTDWRTTFEVEVRVRYSPDAEAPDEAVDLLIGEAFARLAVPFAFVGVEDVVPGTSIDWDFSETDVNVVGATFRLDVVHRTGAATLSAI